MVFEKHKLPLFIKERQTSAVPGDRPQQKASPGLVHQQPQEKVFSGCKNGPEAKERHRIRVRNHAPLVQQIQ